jgi:hypothetical protein
MLQRAAAAWAFSSSGPKCGQGGFTLSAEGSSTAISEPRLFSTPALMTSPGTVKGTKIWPAGVSAMPSPCPPSRVMSSF